MKKKLDKHEHAHPEVKFILFVRTPGKHSDEARVLDEIWTQIMEMMEFAKAYYREAIAACFDS